ncbi:MAG: ABC transporter ATP-binding protein [Candidatus Omnitrophica bacterium]|nr:ABC transporter ATP-binding protein [Candidatus Omnitrophota bacterium]
MLEAKNIHKVYNDGKRDLPVLKGVNLKIEEGAFIAIVGPSGAGKSTLLHILGGLDSPTQGEVVLGQEDIYKLSDVELSRIRNERIGFVFQFYHLLGELSVLENVLMPAWIRAKASGDINARALKLIAQVNLTERLTHLPAQLSGGEKQRVAIARGLMNKPSLLFCDEPTGNLDSKTGTEIIALIKKASLEDKMTVVLVTHNVELTKIADKVYNLKDGVLI